MFVFKPKCLGRGKRLTWHADRIQNHFFHPSIILENNEHIAYPIQINLREGCSGEKLEPDRLVYTTATKPSFFFAEYTVAVVVDFSSLKFNTSFSESNQTSPT